MVDDVESPRCVDGLALDAVDRGPASVDPVGTQAFKNNRVEWDPLNGSTHGRDLAATTSGDVDESLGRSTWRVIRGCEPDWG